MFSQRNHPFTKPPTAMGFNPFEYGFQQLPLNKPFFKNFFKQHPPFQPHSNQQVPPFQMDNPFTSGFMNPNVLQMQNPFSSHFFQGNPQGQSPQHVQQAANPNQIDTYPQPPTSNPQSWLTDGSLDFKKMGGGFQQAMSLYQQVKPLWNLIVK
ncbi:hypothetical protein [Halalkalibacter akibai]|uniref:Uncharacterized protein n=1 Tax=Halalkalibacter akibai (strain ATCC 43226 / DSM 21942 / CIP 109018 / JCM 9157 / 1139) TaxID=1236973 RepID=W4QRN8_HALA3|nr:hypothetical protein [Halalkalibacter akibai]GAE34313.1 hypothetical protein JCM9157_1361 [Halalkalibacter akibai JCM 9157]